MRRRRRPGEHRAAGPGRPNRPWFASIARAAVGVRSGCGRPAGATRPPGCPSRALEARYPGSSPAESRRGTRRRPPRAELPLSVGTCSTVRVCGSSRGRTRRSARFPGSPLQQRRLLGGRHVRPASNAAHTNAAAPSASQGARWRRASAGRSGIATTARARSRSSRRAWSVTATGLSTLRGPGRARASGRAGAGIQRVDGGVMPETVQTAGARHRRPAPARAGAIGSGAVRVVAVHVDERCCPCELAPRAGPVRSQGQHRGPASLPGRVASSSRTGCPMAQCPKASAAAPSALPRGPGRGVVRERRVERDHVPDPVDRELGPERERFREPDHLGANRAGPSRAARRPSARRPAASEPSSRSARWCPARRARPRTSRP